MKELLIANTVLILGYVFYSSYLVKYGSTEWNRYFLVFWIPISIAVASLPDSLMSSAMSTGLVYTYSLPSINIAGSTPSQGVDPNWVFIGYLVLSGAFLVRSLFQLYSVSIIIFRSRSIQVNGVSVRTSKEVQMPFSFFGFVVIPSGIDESEIPVIIEHELAHVRANHSIDIVLIQIVQSISWFNPVVWMYEKAIRINHEYEADKAVLQANYNVVGYKELLMAKALAGHANIGHAMARKSQLHKRFLKMNSSKKNTLWHYGLLIPLIAIAVIGKSCVKEKASEINSQTEQNEPASKEAIKDFIGLESRPEFPGGEQELFKYLGEEIKYPENAKSEGVEGVVYTKFNISETGAIEDVEVLRSPSDDLSNEAIRVVSEMPSWKPAMKDGEKVAVQFTIPIRFELED